MTDKQIIIDGCNVSGCECYSEHREGYCGWHTPCEGDTCPYKLKWALQQLKAKEQECEKLKLQLAHSCHDVLYKNSLAGKLDQLKAENEELKNFHINLVGVKECEIKELVKYKQALTEIKEIALKACECCGECQTEFSTKDYCDFNEILQKISEVINEHN